MRKRLCFCIKSHRSLRTTATETGLNMILLLLFLVYASLIQFEGISEESYFFRAGQDAALHCDESKHYQEIICSNVSWIYNKDGSSSVSVVSKGQVDHSSRMSLSQNCSLIINDVTEEDYGIYTCRLWDTTDVDTVVHLSVLTVSPVPPESSPNPDVLITIQCSLWRKNTQCRQGSIRWLDYKRDVLSVHDFTTRQTNCVSYLTMNRQSEYDRKFTCQYLNARNEELSSADHIVPRIAGVGSQVEYIDRYFRTGQNASLPCDRLKHLGPECSGVNWIYYNSTNSSRLLKVEQGQIVKDNLSSSRLSLSSDCSLMVYNISAGDSGLFICRQPGQRSDADTRVYLRVITVFPVPPSTNQNQETLLTLQCTLWRDGLRPCYHGRFFWLDINGTVLSGPDVTQNKCVSNLTVGRKSQHNRKYTCLYVDNADLIAEDYSLEVNRETRPSLVSIFSAAGLSLLVLLVIAVEVLLKIKYKKNSAQTDL